MSEKDGKVDGYEKTSLITRVNDSPREIWRGPVHSTSDNTWHIDHFGEMIPFDGHVHLWNVVIESSNYMKESEISGDEIRKAVSIRFYVNGEQVYEAFARQPEDALIRAWGLLIQLREFPVQLHALEGEVGRKVYYDRTPAVVDRFIADQGAVILVPEPGWRFPAPVWYDPDEDPEPEDDASVKADLLSEKIWWFRKDKT